MQIFLTFGARLAESSYIWENSTGKIHANVL